MKKLWVVTKNELLRYFVSPLAYIYLLSFLLLNASFAIYFGDFFARGQADLLSMFGFQPWLYLLFISGISMRLWAEEFRTKTIVQIVTMPVSVRTLVWGKFFASWLFCGLALLLTATFWLTVNILGRPDNQVILLGYVASFILAGCMLAIAQTMSALTKNQVVALVLAVLANLLFFWSGIEYILSFFRLFLPDSVIDVIASFSFLSHFATMTHGLVELRDIIFFATVILFFNYTTVLIVNFKTSGTSGWLKSTSRGYYLTAWLFLFAGFFGLNILANNLARNLQYDATAEKIYTLTDSTKDVLKHLSEPVTAKLYFTPLLEQRNPNLRQMFDRVRILLKKYQNIAGEMFAYKVYYPQFLSDEEDIALADGVQAIPLIDINQTALFGLTLEDTLQHKAVIPYFAQDQQGAIEQELTTKIYQMQKPKKTVGVLAGEPIFGAAENSGTFLREPWEFVRKIQESYQVFNIVKAEDFDHPMDALLIFTPKHLTPEFVAKIKQYSQAGGKILLILDPVNEAARLYTYKNAPLEGSDLGKLAAFWGIRFYRDYVVADLQNSITVDATINYNTNPVFSQDVIQFKLPAEDMNPLHPVTQNLHELMLASASVIMPEPAPFESGQIRFVPLLRASRLSSLMSAKVVIDGLNPQKILSMFEPDDNQKIIAAEIEGKTPENPFTLIAVADSDFLYDTFWANKEYFLEKEYVFHNFDNANFVLNALDYLTYDQTLLGLRGKQAESRTFKGIESIRRINSLQFKQQEEQIFAEIDLAKKALQEVWNKKDFEERENFTADELAALDKVQRHLNDLRRQLSDLRYQTFRDIKRIDNIVTVFNLAVVPGAMALLLLVICLWRRRRVKTVRQMHIDLPLLKLAGICLAILLLGIASTYWLNYSRLDAYENKPVFPNLPQQINQIDKIVLRTNQTALTFVQADGIWKLEEMPDLPVYQERIRRLLSTLVNATYFARKSDKAKNLAQFNLLPIEDKNSHVTEINLLAADDLLQQFYVGDINVDIGRGATAAYMRFANQFQVWEVRADFVNLDLDWHNWTYSHLWDLRFGRFNAPQDNEHEAQKLVILMKELLNTPILAVTAMPTTAPLATQNLDIEQENAVTLSFYEQDGKAYAAYTFAPENNNRHLQQMAAYLTGRAVEIEPQRLEVILDLLKQ